MDRFFSFLAGVAILLATAQTSAQFSSGSDGSDGALTFEPSATPVTIILDPKSYDPPLDPDGDGVYHFTTITIPENVTVRLRADKVGWKPLYWLATGDVVIDGVLDLSGENSKPSNLGWGSPGWAVPGPGGFPGGIPTGGNGFGPAGGTGSSTSRGGRHPSNLYLNPFTGGSGGVGGGDYWGGSGAGGLLIASTTSVRINGSIRANGGNARAGNNTEGGGAGGALHLIAPSFSGTGSLTVSGGSTGFNTAESGWIRIEATQNTFTGTFSGDWARRRMVTLIPEPLVIDVSRDPDIRMVSIGGAIVPASPEGSFLIPDVVLDTNEPVEFVLEARNVPVGAVPRVHLFSDTDLYISFQTSPLAGTEQLSTSTGIRTVPRGYSRGFVWVSWTP